MTTTQILSLIVIGLVTTVGPVPRAHAADVVVAERASSSVASSAASSSAASSSVASSSAASSSAASSSAAVSDVWLISTRGLPIPCSQYGVSERMSFRQYDGFQFLASSKQEFLASLDPGQTTCFFVHGNRFSANDARCIGLRVRRRLDCGDVRFRYVIWSWPSDRIKGMMRDARAKAARADGESYYLGSVLAELPPEADVSLIGYSFGARAITGGLHLLGGGVITGNSLGRADEKFVRPRAVLMAAAMPRSWLLPGGANGLAPFQVERMLVLYNPRDPALRRFPIVFRPGHPQALGLEGIAARQLGPSGNLLRQYNVSNMIGRSHSFERYTDSPGVMSTVRRAAIDRPSS